MSILFSLLTNPVTISVLVLCVLCLTGLNVLLSMLIACIIGGVAGGIPLLNAPEGTQTVMQLLTGGFASNATTALAYILLGTFATCIATTGLADILSKKLSRLLGECVPKRGFSRQKALADSFGRLPGLLDGVGMKAHERRLVHHDGARLGKAPS